MFTVREPNFKNAVSQNYFRYWLSLRQGELIPTRSAFRPEDVPELMRFFAIYEPVSPDFIKIRLAGTEMTRRHGFESTGTNYLDLVEPKRRANASKAFFLIAGQPCGMRVALRHRYDNGLIVDTEALGMPVKNPSGGLPLLYYTVCPIDQELEKPIEPMKKSQPLLVLEREFIDLGAGIPEFEE